MDLPGSPSDKDLNAKADGISMFAIFLLSRGVYNLKKEGLGDYATFTMDLTEDTWLPEWMEFDKLYLFRSEDLKKEAKSTMMPFSAMFPITAVSRMQLVDGGKFIIRFQMGEDTLAVQFPNIIECWKFYYYGRTLYYNAMEFYASLNHTISLNIRILLDDFRESSIPNVLAVIINANNKRENQLLAAKTKTFVDEDMINFQGLTRLYERILVAYYSIETPEKYFPKLKMITDQFHRYYFQFIKELFANPYTDVRSADPGHPRRPALRPAPLGRPGQLGDRRRRLLHPVHLPGPLLQDQVHQGRPGAPHEPLP